MDTKRDEIVNETGGIYKVTAEDWAEFQSRRDVLHERGQQVEAAIQAYEQAVRVARDALDEVVVDYEQAVADIERFCDDISTAILDSCTDAVPPDLREQAVEWANTWTTCGSPEGVPRVRPVRVPEVNVVERNVERLSHIPRYIEDACV